MTPEQIESGDPDRLPYLITETATQQRLRVQFDLLTTQDLIALSEVPWTNAVFANVWRSLAANQGDALKLVRADEPQGEILGLLKIGSMNLAGGFLCGSLLETTPASQMEQPARVYRDIGAVLVARLVVESYLFGGEGKLLVTARGAASGFYVKLGFTGIPTSPRGFVLAKAKSMDILRRTLLLESDQDTLTGG